MAGRKQNTNSHWILFERFPCSILRLLRGFYVLPCSLILQGKVGDGQIKYFPDIVGHGLHSPWNYYSLEKTLGNVAFGNGELLNVAGELL